MCSAHFEPPTWKLSTTIMQPTICNHSQNQSKARAIATINKFLELISMLWPWYQIESADKKEKPSRLQIVSMSIFACLSLLTKQSFVEQGWGAYTCKLGKLSMQELGRHIHVFRFQYRQYCHTEWSYQQCTIDIHKFQAYSSVFFKLAWCSWLVPCTNATV